MRATGRDVAALPPIGAGPRGERLSDAIADATFDGDSDGRAVLHDRALLVREPSNVRWLTGFTGSNAWVVVRGGQLALATDGRYGDQASAELAAAGVDAELIVVGSAPELLERVIGIARGAEIVGAEAHHLSYEQWTTLAADLPLTAAGRLVEQLRRRKDAAELARIEAAGRIAAAALGDVAPMLGDGVGELDVRDELEHRMRRLGADGPAYDTLVASGPEHAARPHHHPADRVIGPGDTVVIDVGALVDGYRSDMTRTFVVGEPSAEQLDRYELVLAAQRAGLATAAAGCRAVDLDGACRRVIDESGLGDWFAHGTGHGVGLDIHEEPYIGRSSPEREVLAAGDVVSVEPGVYHAGFGGIRIEDLVVITEAGCRPLTDFPKERACLPSPPTI